MHVVLAIANPPVFSLAFADDAKGAQIDRDDSQCRRECESPLLLWPLQMVIGISVLSSGWVESEKFLRACHEGELVSLCFALYSMEMDEPRVSEGIRFWPFYKPCQEDVYDY